MSSNAPSGGMNEIVRSFSNLDSRTHWWNLTSSISIAFPRALRPVLSNMTLSFSPSRLRAISNT